MKSNTRPIRSVLVTLDIVEVQCNREAFLDAFFCTEEREELKTRNVRSTAGRLALKRAVLHLLSEGKDRVLTEKAIVLGRQPNGRPALLSAGDRPTGSLSNNLFLSISHTKSTAYGLAVLQED
ncbi:MAG: hypothetical protein MUO63_09375 [Desulfobulbaceae bacterium]|nr:hypothetical protein [Desulfobulbaceae bacterium]